MPQINRQSRDFTAKTTHGEKSLSDYRSKWLVLFAHPSDFTQVCTTKATSTLTGTSAKNPFNTC
ncbi:redoxin domain-containing protein [Vreelandella andesensis]|uniref:redoxin domain-containing protein n=1 Tax=Vreelandella andesensis TaxID=447567 RepID=UPI001FC8F7A8|nr:redoxin domain-containing protein [Halomonas andesensis]